MRSGEKVGVEGVSFSARPQLGLVSRTTEGYVTR